MIERIRHSAKVWMWKRTFRPGEVVTRFIAKDIRRDVEVIDVSEVSEGIITGRARTWNVLYAFKGIKEKPPFGSVRRIDIPNLWKWDGEQWGGPVADSIDREY